MVDIRRVSNKIVFDKEVSRVISELYLEYGYNIQDLMERFGVSRPVVKRALKDEGVQLRRGNKNKRVNHLAFRNLTPASCYWMGYLAGDGCIHRVGGGGKNHALAVTLFSNDAEHIEKFKKFLRSEHKTLHKGDKAYGISIASEQLAGDLTSRGITPRKSLDLYILDDRLINSLDFLRGVIDSDGSIILLTESGAANITITTGSLYFAYQLKLAIKLVLGIDAAVYYKKEKNVYFVSFSARGDILNALSNLYEHTSEEISLDRKRNKALAILELNKSKPVGVDPNQIRLHTDKVVIVDTDGSLTNGTVFYDDYGRVGRMFDVRDGHGISLLRDAGFDVVMISGERDASLYHRAKKLNVMLFTVTGNRYEFIREVVNTVSKGSLGMSDIIYFADDTIDVPIMKDARIVGCPANAHKEVVRLVKSKNGFVSPTNGGNAAFRRFADWLIGEVG